MSVSIEEIELEALLARMKAASGQLDVALSYLTDTEGGAKAYLNAPSIRGLRAALLRVRAVVKALRCRDRALRWVSRRSHHRWERHVL